AEYLRTLVLHHVLSSSCLILRSIKIAYYYQQFDYFLIDIICFCSLRLRRMLIEIPKRWIEDTLHRTALKYTAGLSCVSGSLLQQIKLSRLGMKL
ncbi:hypothetical protein V1525DRAFT_349337, partial [Lipomyces kononenkoae]